MTEQEKKNLKVIVPLLICLSDEPYELHHPDYILEKLDRALGEGERAFNMLSSHNKSRLFRYFTNLKWELKIEDFYTTEEIKEILGIFE